MAFIWCSGYRQQDVKEKIDGDEIMSAESIQSKLDKAYGTVAKTLGRDFAIYRPDGIDNPIRSANYIYEQKASFSIDEKFKTVAKSGLSIWYAWTDARLGTLFNLKNGDILFNSLEDETYIIVGMEPHLAHQAIKANDRISISRAGDSGYGDNDGTGFAPGNIVAGEVVATNVPCQILQPSSYGLGGYVPVASNAEDSISNYEVYLNDTFNEIAIRDKLTDQFGNISEVQEKYETDTGTKLVCRGIPQ